MLKRYRLMAVTGLVAAILLGACSGGGDDAKKEEKTETGTKPAAAAVDAKAAAQGKELATANGCVACHSADGSSGVGPTWKGLYGNSRPLASGDPVTADDAYLKESIVNPNAKVVKSFTAGAMPAEYGKTLNDTQIQSVIEYIKSLK